MIIEMMMTGPTFTILLPPTAPAATTGGNGIISLLWTYANASYTTQIYRDGVFIFETAAGVTNYDDTVAASTTHSYQLRHHLTTNYSSYTKVFSGLAGGPPPPTPTPGSFTAVASTDNAILNWVNTNASYQIRVYRNSILYQTLAANSTAYTDAVIANGTYNYYLAYWTGSIEEPATATIPVTINYIQTIAAPTGFTVTAPFTDQAALSWTNGVTGALITTEIYRDTKPQATTLLTTVLSGVTTYNDNSVVSGTTYYYCIRHVQSGTPIGQSAYTNYMQIIMPLITFKAYNLIFNTTTSLFNVTWTTSTVIPRNGFSVNRGTWSSTSLASGPSANAITSPNTYSSGEVYASNGIQDTMTLAFLNIVDSNNNILSQVRNLQTLYKHLA